MKSDIRLDVLGNTSPFSLSGESSGYLITVNGSSYLLECGAPVFPSLGFHAIEQLKGIFATHSHEDHRRWFTDIVLFNYYDSRNSKRVRLISSESILEEYHKNSKGALERSLSPDSKRIIDIPYEGMVEEVTIGPRSRYFIGLEREGEEGRYRFLVKDRQGNLLGPHRAKIVINPKANRPRLLYRDDETGEWVEPESYYPFSSTLFYEENQNTFKDVDAGFTVDAVKSPVWHGVPTIAFRFKTAKNSLFYSADTVYKPALWKELCETRRVQNFESLSRKEFEKRSVILGDINDFIERTWSRQRYESALSAYAGSVVIHDVARKNSVVHTDYLNICRAEIDNLIFTHSPDNLTACRPILKSGNSLLLKDGKIYERANGTLYPLDADVYVKHFSGYLVGYRAENGPYKVIEKEGFLGVVPLESPEEGLMRVMLFEDVGGEYFPLLERADSFYRLRPDGKVEEVSIQGDRSTGRLAKNRRGKIKPSP
jgi:ribonuclease BN (tRNA processing enzyme)